MPSPIDKSDYAMDQVFGPDGLLANHLPGFELREEQTVMARAVCRSLKTGSPLLLEAGTGTGKSLAYLIPLILWTVQHKTRALISTQTKTLQHQIIEKDLPFLQEHLGLSFRYALCLGNENYLCRARLTAVEERKGGEYELVRGFESWRPRLLKWARETETGIHAEVDFALPDNVWRAVCRQSDACSGPHCPFMDLCFYGRARRRQALSQILVANHHLFFANVATDYNLLPEFHAAVFDEAHTLENIAADYFGVRVSRADCESFASSLYSSGKRRGFLNRHSEILHDRWNDLVDMAEKSRQTLRELFRILDKRIPPYENRVRYCDPLKDLPDYAGPLTRLLKAFEKEFPPVENGERNEATVVRNKGMAVLDGLSVLTEFKIENGVYWLERESTRRGRRDADISLNYVPLNVAELMRDRVYANTGPVILVSATLSDGSSFSFIRERLGLKDVLEVILGSPFDYESHVGVFADPQAPAPTDREGFEAYLIQTVPRILAEVPGGTFVLFTSLRLMDRVYEAVVRNGIEGEERPTLLKQGDLPKEEILRQFKQSGRAALFGSNTFWQGVDVPGEALSCVVLTRLPFAVPDDPVCQARQERVEASGRSAFFEFQVPNAIMMFRQGFGRLIRKHDDRGVVAVLDSRIITKQYGRKFLSAIPKCQPIEEIEEIGAFFRRARG
jgi:ATP-dependent DNA helicase DinG